MLPESGDDSIATQQCLDLGFMSAESAVKESRILSSSLFEYIFSEGQSSSGVEQSGLLEF